MKKIILSCLALAALSACQTTGSLRPGEVMGTDIGSILSREAGMTISRSDEDKMNTEIDKALYFSENGLTTRWYAGYNVRIRPTGVVRDRRDRDCRRFRHGHMMDGDWYNATAIACRERNIPWYLISNRWDRNPGRHDNRRDRDDDWGGRYESERGNWDNLSDELKGNPADGSYDDFGPRNVSRSW